MKKIYFVFIFVFVLLFGYIGINKWLSYEDDPLTQAKRMYPLGYGNPYIIVKTDGTGGKEITTPYVYAVIKPSEQISSASLSWRRIGQSAVNLDQFINKKVYIDGEYYLGIPLLIQKPENDPYGLTTAQPVIKITSVTFAQ